MKKQRHTIDLTLSFQWFCLAAADGQIEELKTKIAGDEKATTVRIQWLLSMEEFDVLPPSGQKCFEVLNQ